MVKSIPAAQIKKSPKIAIITVNYAEKLAVDAVMQDKVTFVKYKAEGDHRLRVITRETHRFFPQLHTVRVPKALILSDFYSVVVEYRPFVIRLSFGPQEAIWMITRGLQMAF